MIYPCFEVNLLDHAIPSTATVFGHCVFFKSFKSCTTGTRTISRRPIDSCQRLANDINYLLR